MANTQTAGAPTFIYWLGELAKFKMPKFHNEKRMPFIRYFLFIVICGALTSQLFTWEVYTELGGAKATAVTLYYVCWIGWLTVHTLLQEYENLQDHRLIVLELGFMVFGAFNSSTYLHEELANGKTITEGLAFLLGCQTMLVDYLILVGLRIKKPPPPETT